MRFFTFSLIYIICFNISFLNAKNETSNIINKYSEFRNLNKLKEINDIYINCYKLENNNNKSTLDFRCIIPNKNRIDLQFGQQTNKIIENNDKSWVKAGIFPTQTIDSFNKTILYILKNVVYGPFFNYQKNDIKLSKNFEKILGFDCQKLILENEVEIYINNIDNSLIKLREIRNLGNLNELLEIYFENYKDFEGIKFPTKISAYIGQKEFLINIDNIFYNSGFTDIDFSYPN